MTANLNPRQRSPVIFDVVSPDGSTTLLPAGIRMVLVVGPQQIQISYRRNRQSIQTKGGFIIQHWGSEPTSVQLEMATGGFVRLYTGLSAVTGGAVAPSLGGSRRDTLAYDSYLDILALFHNNGAIYGQDGQIVLQGKILMEFQGQKFYGWFDDLTVTEDAQIPFMFKLSGKMTIAKETMALRSPQ